MRLVKWRGATTCPRAILGRCLHHRMPGHHTFRRSSCNPNSTLIQWTNVNGACSWEFSIVTNQWTRHCNGWPDDPMILPRLDYTGDTNHPWWPSTLPPAGQQCGTNADCVVYLKPDGGPPAYNKLDYTSAQVYTGQYCQTADESGGFDPTCEPTFTVQATWNVRMILHCCCCAQGTHTLVSGRAQARSATAGVQQRSGVE